ncbi:MAG: LPS export ABC transporter permease LptG [Burkholderiaceae bacterium]|nr:LPS export ABC transporter permease LptG [Burkholderiaceae bacterium]
MSVLSRYMGREIRAAVIFVLAGFLALFAFFDFISEIEDVGKGAYGLRHALIFVLLGLPAHVYELLPIAVLIGAIYAMAQFASNSEFTAMRAAGLGRGRALQAMFRTGVVLALATALIGEFVAPSAEKLAQGIRLGAIGGSIGGKFRSGIWIKDDPRDGGQAEGGSARARRFVNIGELEPDASMRRVRIFEFDDAQRLSRIIRADRGVYVDRGQWRLLGVTTVTLSHRELFRGAPLLSSQTTTAAEIDWASSLTPDLLGVLIVMPERMSAWNLFRYIQHLRDNQQDAVRYEIAFWKKLVYPFAVLVMLALALPSAYMQARAGGVGYKVFAGIMLGVAFHFLNGLFAHLGLLNTWPAWLSASLPSVVALLLALSMLAWVDRAR